MTSREVIPMKGPLALSLNLPGSKSITNRAFLCAALAKGTSYIYGALDSDDTHAMLQALKKLGVKVLHKKTHIQVKGVAGSFKGGNVTLDAGASGTTTRFLTALSVLRKGKTRIRGTRRMMERPMKDLEDALGQLKGAEGVISVRGDKSSQFLSALLMVAPYLGPLKIKVAGELVSKPYIDTTLAVMKSFGVKVRNKDYRVFEVKKQGYKGCRYEVEGDASAASYFSALNFLHGGKLQFANLDYKKSIQGDVNFPEALRQLKKRSPRVIDMKSMPDAALTLACVAPFVRGETRITGLSTLRLKETDRLAALQKELSKVGVRVTKTKSSLTVRYAGGQKQDTNETFSIGTYDDHRMAMAFAVLGTKMPGITIEDPGCTAKTYPEFWQDLERAYLRPIKLGHRNLLLTGMRCSGKTFYGKKIAKMLGRNFVDLDKEIERAEGMKVHEVVKGKGWPYFRKIEQKICSQVAGTEGLVISAGGGVVLSPANMRNLKKGALNVFIYADPGALCKRIKADRKRPSLTGQEPEREISGVWKERRALYLKYADVIWDDTGGRVLKKALQNGTLFIG